uniref:Secreted protein n=1 Tax=Cacopsylla melanoneura TaxID=428564 RepID=A0A8D8Z903_9HEMI
MDLVRSQIPCFSILLFSRVFVFLQPNVPCVSRCHLGNDWSSTSFLIHHVYSMCNLNVTIFHIFDSNCFPNLFHYLNCIFTFCFGDVSYLNIFYSLAIFQRIYSGILFSGFLFQCRVFLFQCL